MFRELRKAIKKDKDVLQQNANDPRFISRWCDKFDPRGEYGVQPLEKNIRRHAGVRFKYQHNK